MRTHCPTTRLWWTRLSWQALEGLECPHLICSYGPGGLCHSGTCFTSGGRRPQPPATGIVSGNLETSNPGSGDVWARGNVPSTPGPRPSGTHCSWSLRHWSLSVRPHLVLVGWSDCYLNALQPLLITGQVKKTRHCSRLLNLFPGYCSRQFRIFCSECIMRSPLTTPLKFCYQFI